MNILHWTNRQFHNLQNNPKEINFDFINHSHSYSDISKNLEIIPKRHKINLKEEFNIHEANKTEPNIQINFQ